MGSMYEALVDAIKVPVLNVPTGPVAGRVFRTGHVPDLDEVTPPYVTIDYPVTFTPALRGDARTMAWQPDGVVDVWQKVGEEESQDGVWEQVLALLDGAQLAGYDGKVHSCQVLDAGRLLDEPEDGWLRHTILLRIPHLRP